MSREKTSGAVARGLAVLVPITMCPRTIPSSSAFGSPRSRIWSLRLQKMAPGFAVIPVPARLEMSEDTS